MTTQTVTQAVAKRDAGAAELVRQSRSWFATIVPSHIDAKAFVALTLAYLRKNPKLAAAAQRNPASFMAALSECARLGLIPGDTYHLVPFEDTRNDTVDITGMVDYTGEIELIYRAGAVSSVKAEIVYSKDRFRYTTDMDRPEHDPDWFGDRGDLIGAYAYAVMKDGATSKVVIYSKAEIDKVKAVSKTSSRSDSPWQKWYDRMALKTVIHRLEHFVPTSAEYRREQLRAAAEISQQVASSAVPEPPGPGIVDAEIVDDSPEEVTPPQKATTGQVGIISRQLSKLGVADENRLSTLTQLAGRDLTTAGDLAQDEAARIRGLLDQCKEDRGALVELLATGALPAQEQDAGDGNE